MPPLNTDRTTDLVRRLQQGDERAREELISSYQGYIIKLARKYCRENIDILNTDAYSVALIAFNEAAENYREEKGIPFTSFAGQVINNRLIDLLRSNSKHQIEITVEKLPEYPGRNQADPVDEDYTPDMAWFEQELAKYNITLEDLVRETPKHRDTRCRALAMAREVVNDPHLLESLQRRKALPFKSLLFHFKCNPKTIQRHRKYIIAACIALSGTSAYLKEYVRSVAKGCDEHDS